MLLPALRPPQLTGLNKACPRTDILASGKNRLILVLAQIVEYFKPAYVVLEQVGSGGGGFLG